MISVNNSTKPKAIETGVGILLALGLSQSKIAVLGELAERHHFSVVVGDAECDLAAIPAFAVVADPIRLTKEQFDLSMASQDEAARVLFTENPPWTIPLAVRGSVIVDRDLFRDIGVLTFRILVRKRLFGQNPVEEGVGTRLYTLDSAFQPPYEFTGRLLAFCLDRCATDAGVITRECWLYRTDDGHYLLHSATDADRPERAIYRNASAKAILKRAERFLADGATAQSAAFLRDAARAMQMGPIRKGEENGLS